MKKRDTISPCSLPRRTAPPKKTSMLNFLSRLSVIESLPRGAMCCDLGEFEVKSRHRGPSLETPGIQPRKRVGPEQKPGNRTDLSKSRTNGYDGLVPSSTLIMTYCNKKYLSHREKSFGLGKTTLKSKKILNTPSPATRPLTMCPTCPNAASASARAWRWVLRVLFNARTCSA